MTNTKNSCKVQSVEICGNSCPGMIHDRTSIASQFPGHGCMGDLIIDRSFGLRATWVITLLWLICFTCYPWVTSQLIGALVCELRGSLHCFGLFVLLAIHG